MQKYLSIYNLIKTHLEPFRSLDPSNLAGLGLDLKFSSPEDTSSNMASLKINGSGFEFGWTRPKTDP